MSREEYEKLLIRAGHHIHLLGCMEADMGHKCDHKPEIWHGVVMEADAAFHVLFDYLGMSVPPENPPNPAVPF